MPIALGVSAVPYVARSALTAVLAVILIPPVHAVCASSGGSHAAMPNKMSDYSPDNRAFNTAARSSIGLT